VLVHPESPSREPLWLQPAAAAIVVSLLLGSRSERDSGPVGG
jgi:hypothetical protein